MLSCFHAQFMGVEADFTHVREEVRMRGVTPAALLRRSLRSGGLQHWWGSGVGGYCAIGSFFLPVILKIIS